MTIPDGRVYPAGLTVRELKDLIRNWPDLHEDGDPSTVWLGYEGLSRPVMGVYPLNFRYSSDGHDHADILFECDGEGGDS